MIETSELSIRAARERTAHCATAGFAVVVLMALASVRPVSASPLDSIDAAAESVLCPHGDSVGKGMSFPRAVIANLGTTTQDIPADYKIYNVPEHAVVFDETETLTVQPDREQVILYGAVYLDTGTYVAEVTTQVPGDQNPANDVAVDTFTVINAEHNVGVDQILRPNAIEDTLPFTPVADVRNYGTCSETFMVWSQIRSYPGGAQMYLDSVLVTDLHAGTGRTETMPSPWAGHHPAHQQYLAKAWTAILGDPYPEDDTSFKMFTVVASGLAEPNPRRDGLRSLSIVPNPSSGRITVRITRDNPQVPEHAALTICDAAGRKLKEIPISGAGYAMPRSIQLSGLPDGLYFVRLANGRETTETKLILARGERSR